MKRVLASIIFGLAFPIVYGALAALMTVIFPGTFASTIQIFGEPAPGPVYAPILATVYLYNWIKLNDFVGIPLIFDTLWFRAVLTIITPVAFYSGLSYFVLMKLGFASSKSVETWSDPPPPSNIS